jgi:hypothetical protein
MGKGRGRGRGRKESRQGRMRTLKRTVGRMTMVFGGAIRRRRVITESKERSCGGGSLGALL